MVPAALVRRLYSHPRYDGTKGFYDWLRSHCRPYMRVLNVGAGPETKRPVRILKGEVRAVIGVDIDPIVLTNRELDAAQVSDGVSLPFANESFDMAYGDYVVEHVEYPLAFLREIRRVLKPRGAFFFRTANRWHYAPLISSITPHWFHKLIANRVRNLPTDAHEPWRTFYRLNSKRAVAKAAALAGFSSHELRLVETEPSYLMFNTAAFLLGVAYERTVNSHDALSGLRSSLTGKLVK